MSVPHRMKILIQTQYQRWIKCLEKIVGGIDMTDVNLSVSENVYLELSAKAEEAGQSINEYCQWILGRSLERDEEVVTLKKHLKALREEVNDIQAINVELQKSIDVMEEEKEPE